MKKITKGVQAPGLTEWFEANADLPQNLSYGAAEFPFNKVLKGLLVEQGFICAYTLLRINENSAHVEHLKPQTLCRKEDQERKKAHQRQLREDIAWTNMVACTPEPNSKVKPPYGATKKDDWWDNSNFLSPLNETCEGRFAFKADGKILPNSATDVAAVETIKNIGLDNDKLSELRKTAFLSAGIHRRSEKAITSVAKVEQLIARWSRKNQVTSECEEFCVPLVQVAKEYAHFLRAKGYKE